MEMRLKLRWGVWTAILAGACLCAFWTVGCKEQSTSPTAPANKSATAATYANTRCPIMNTPIDPAAVTPDLTRTYKGKVVAFCCNVCPPQWDKLTDTQKDAKLAAVMPPASQPAYGPQ